jgi:hypothetical protein
VIAHRLLALAAAALALPCGAACYTHQCDATNLPPYEGGEMVNADTYETNPLASPAEPWVNFPGGATLTVTYPATVQKAVAGRPITGLQAYVGISDQPNGGGANFTNASGGLAEFSDAGATGFSVTNATCAHYFAWFQVTFAPADSGAADSGE